MQSICTTTYFYILAAKHPASTRSRTLSAVDLSRPASIPLTAGYLEGRMKQRALDAALRQESLSENLHRCRGVVLIVSFALLFMPRAAGSIVISDASATMAIVARKMFPGSGMVNDGGQESKRYAVIFDAGSSGSRVHVYCFDENLDLVHIGNELEIFEQIKPGLSAYAEDPQKAANSLFPLLEKAENDVPEQLRQTTPVKVGATAGLRSLGEEESEQILEAVRDLLQKNSSFKFESEWVTVLDGKQEGAYEWVTINYLLGKLGKSYSSTVGVVDLGGGSVQMAYAISEEVAANAPNPLDGEESYVQKLFLKGTTYYLYVHSYLHFGLLAARAEILKVSDGSSRCILGGYNGSYKYGGNEYNASASPSGASFSKCKSDVVKALKVDDACTHVNCTFGGVWNGGGGAGQKKLFVASFFFDRAAEAGFVDGKLPTAKVKPHNFKKAAKQACKLNVEDARSTYPLVQEANLPYLCMDLVYEFSLLVDGFGLDAHRDVTLVKQVQYGDALVEAAWPLGTAIEAVSASR